MSNFKKLATKLIAISAIALIALTTLATSAFATDPPPITPQGTSGDLSIGVASVAGDRAFAALVCNNGTDDVIEISFDINSTNYDIGTGVALPPGFAGSNAPSSGNFDTNTQVWTGTLMGSDSALAATPDPLPTPQCVAIGFVGDVTGPVGQTITFTAEILSSTLGDSTPNVDPNDTNDVASMTTPPIALDPNLVLETRLLTSGEITNGTPVSYELTIKNTGAGQFVNDGGNPMGVYFILPEGTTFVDVTDEDLTDNLTVSTCGSQGNVGSGPQRLPAFAGYDAELAGCQVIPTSGFVPAGASYKLKFNMIANGPFSTGDTEVIAILVANDKDSILLQLAMFTPSTDPFNIDNDNFVYLGFDGSELRATVARCAGIGDVVTSNTACFTMSFNKTIFADSLDPTDLVVTNGEIDSLTRVGNNLWEIRLKNLTPNQVVSITVSPTNDILDYSAVIAATQVLGINTVRYEVAADAAATRAQGSLPDTGFDLQVLVSALLLIGSGLVMLRFSKLNRATI